ncbi:MULTISPECIES: hypothetical protein [unclassified Kitasatospora]|uniref:hypothetical protein n=1 Tax=unclassified Kitasatospora TaxID=2633591 RepID=UPI00247576BF|nr:hypothetical protein [Kitasatospora sp. MAP12-44]
MTTTQHQPEQAAMRGLLQAVTEELGRPGPDRFGLTMTGDEQYVWLDHPAHPARAASKGSDPD